MDDVTQFINAPNTTTLAQTFLYRGPKRMQADFFDIYRHCSGIITDELVTRLRGLAVASLFVAYFWQTISLAIEEFKYLICF